MRFLLSDQITFDVSFGSTVQKSPGSYEYDRIDFAIRNIPLAADEAYLNEIVAAANPRVQKVLNGLVEHMFNLVKESYGR